MTEHDLSFIQNYSKIRQRLYNTGRPDTDNLGSKVVVRRHAHDRLIKDMERQAAERERAKVLNFLAPPRWRVIVNDVAEKHGLKAKDILGQCRRNRMVLARHEAMFRIATETSLSTPEIGRFMDRDHSTVIHGMRTHARRNGLPLTRGGVDA